MQNTDRIIIEVRTSRVGEETPEAMVQFLVSLTGLKKKLFLFVKRGVPISLEIAAYNQTIHFYVTVPSQYKTNTKLFWKASLFLNTQNRF
ncbi:MAG: hypothetical protein HYT11_01880 [Candidatus Levybacteria bacterium]|nr:hypothetical protein [Candidatus Levybacteria bacterium]